MPKVLSWNILASEWIDKSDYPTISSGELFNVTRIKTIIDTLTSYDPDIILLQEVMPYEYNIIRKKFSHNYYISRIHRVVWGEPPSKSGNVTLLRLCKYSNISTTGIMECCTFTKCRNIPTNKIIKIYNIHFDYDSPNKRKFQIKQLVEFECHKTYPCIIGGDFNKQINARNIPGFTVHNFCKTYYIGKHVNIDNILTRNFGFYRHDKNCISLEQSDETIFKMIGSDHLPVVAHLQLSS